MLPVVIYTGKVEFLSQFYTSRKCREAATQSYNTYMEHVGNFSLQSRRIGTDHQYQNGSVQKGR